MSVVDPTIDDLLSATDENRFLLCEMASRRARDINDMMRNQHNRAEQLADIEDITMFMSDDEGHAPNPLSIAFDEIAPKRDENGDLAPAGDLSYDQGVLDAALGLSHAAPAEPVGEL
jgi:DNA-directed RNA polymerase subunit omega